MGLQRLENRVAIVTGAASGIGRASAELFAEEGARVVAVDLPTSDLAFDHRGIVPLGVDLATDEGPQAAVDKAIMEFDGLDIVYSNAGVSGRAFPGDMTDEFWDRTLGVNLRAGFRLARSAIPHLITSKAGRFIATASIMAISSDYGLAAYSASKAGVIGLIKNLALELGRSGVTCNAIMPGAILTGMTEATLTQDDIAKVWARKAALKRLGRPLDVARVAMFLASDEAGFITGQAIAVDGGMLLRV
jgi:NAD(P)-dependent dehydrogenase (short-subunit alcohol dehydrogenase family)